MRGGKVGVWGGVVTEEDVVIAGQVGIGDHARIEKGAVLGGQCGILPHKIVRAGQTVWGTPARPLKEHLEQQALVARLPRLLEQSNFPRIERASQRPAAEKEAKKSSPRQKKG